MNNEHGVVFELDFLFATCKLNENERIKVKDVIENELMIDKPEGQEFNEETVKKQLRKIIPVFNSKEMENVYGDDDIEVIKAVTAAEKSVTKDAELEQISRKRRLSGSSTASSGVSVESDFKKPRPARASLPNDGSKEFKMPTSYSSIGPIIPQTPKKTPSLVTPRATPRKKNIPPPSATSRDQSHVFQTPMKSRSNSQMLQTPSKANMKTPNKIKTPPKQLSKPPVTPFETPRKSNSTPMAPPSTVKKRNSGYAPGMFPCDECEKAYSSKAARSNHKRLKHQMSNQVSGEIKMEKEDQRIPDSLPLLDQGPKSGISTNENTTSNTEEMSEKGDDVTSNQEIKPQLFSKPPVRLFECDGCGKSYQSSMKLKMHKKRSCQGGKDLEDTGSRPKSSIMTEQDGVTLEEVLESSVNERKEVEPLIDKTVDTSDTQEIQNMLMLDNLDDDDDDDDDIEMIDIVNKTSAVTKEIPIGKIKNETQVDPTEIELEAKTAESKSDNNVEDKSDNNVEDSIEDEQLNTENTIHDTTEEVNTGENESEDMVEVLKKSKYFVENPKMLEKCSEEILPTYQKALKCLDGWKYKKNEILKENGQRIPTCHFLSPDNIILRSAVAVLEYMRIIGEGKVGLEKLASKLKIKPHNIENYIGKYMFDHQI